MNRSYERNIIDVHTLESKHDPNTYFVLAHCIHWNVHTLHTRSNTLMCIHYIHWNAYLRIYTESHFWVWLTDMSYSYWLVFWPLTNGVQWNPNNIQHGRDTLASRTHWVGNMSRHRQSYYYFIFLYDMHLWFASQRPLCRKSKRIISYVWILLY